MDYSGSDYPGIRQSAFLVLVLMIIQSVIKSLLSFLQHTTLITLINSIFMLGLLLFFLRYMIKNNHLDKSQFTLKKINAVILLSGVLGVICAHFIPLPGFSFFKEDMLNKIFLDYIENQTDLFYFIFMCLIIPVYEELLFRGVVLGGLLKRYSPLVAIGISAILFAVLHLTLSGPLMFGLFVGWIYYRTRNLLYCIIIHSFINALAFAGRYVSSKKLINIEEINNFIQINKFLISTGLLLLLAICIYVLHSRFKKNNSGQQMYLEAPLP
ncbi:MAG: Abortive infection protein [Adhaeribacter sp.]|nr:Abortive infection protein [Adhaeribacter sp.]